MSTHFLPAFYKNATIDLQKLQDSPQHLSKGTCEHALAVCQCYRIRGICSLFLTGSAVELFQDFRSSASYFCGYLELAEGQQLGSLLPVFDAIVSEDSTSLQTLQNYLTQPWNERLPSEELFLYGRILVEVAVHGEIATDKHSAVIEFTENAGDTVRAGICSSLMTHNASLFHEALTELLDAHRDYFDQLVDAEAIAPEVAETEGNLCVEGVALCRLADRLGFEIPDNYPYVPSLLRSEIRL